MSRKRQPPAPFRLKFGGTRKTLPAATLKQAVKDARYWSQWGQKRVCVERRLPSGGWEFMKCWLRGD